MLISQRTISGVFVLAGLVLGSSRSGAQVRPDPGAISLGNAPSRVTGFELELHGSEHAYAGRTSRLRGVAYEVRDMATLRPLAGAHVHCAIEPAIGAAPAVRREVIAGSDGRFDLELEVPESARAASRIVIDVENGGRSRTFTQTLTVHSPAAVTLLTDRRLYEPGETIHAWVRVLDVFTRAPLRQRRVEIAVNGDGPTAPRFGIVTVSTSAGGVANLDLPLPMSAPDRGLTVTARLLDDGGSAALRTSIRVGRRTVETLMADTRLDVGVLAPGGRTHGTVTVRAASGAPVAAARVEIHGDRQSDPPQSVLTTDARGIAAFTWTTPEYLAGSIEGHRVNVTVLHPAYGTVRSMASYVLARVPYAIEVIAAHGGVVPETHDTAFVAIRNALGAAAPEGTPVLVSGIAIEGGRYRGNTDLHGLVSVPIRVDRGAVAMHGESGCAGRVAASFEVAVGASEEFTQRVCVPVAAEARVLPRLAATVVAPGSRIEVVLERHPSVRDRAVVLDLLAGTGDGTVIVSSRVARGQNRGSMALPAGHVGFMRVRARPLDGHGVAEGTGASDAVLVRPASAFQLRVDAEAPMYRPRDRARILVHTPPRVEGGHVALVVRDLAAHGGERDFALEWLDGAFQRAVVDPNTRDADRLVRSALAAALVEDTAAVPAPPFEPVVDEDGEEFDASAASARGDLRDPFALRDELVRRGLRTVMTAIETAVDRASRETSSGIFLHGTGRRGFDPRIVHTLLDDGSLPRASALTLGGGEVEVAMLTRIDPAFTFDIVARRVARKRLVRLLAALAHFVDLGADQRSPVAGDPPGRWLSRMVQRGVITAGDLHDPWGGAFVLHRNPRSRRALVVSARATGWELLSPGPDRIAGTADDVVDPFERVVPSGSVYAWVSGEDALMRSLAALDPGAEVVAQIAAAYGRVAAGLHEELVGDVASASDSESSGFGTLSLGGVGSIGHGGGTGSGSGYGAGRGHLTTGPSLMANGLAALVRERFPATLHFVAETTMDASGTTAIEVPLADALTTYRIEAIAWTDDGWTSSARAEVRVDQDAVVDAPTPAYSAPGDVIRLPVRLANRSVHAVSARLSIVASDGLDVSVSTPANIAVAPGDAREAIMTVTARQPGRGTLTIRAVDTAGNVVDSVRRPFEIVSETRPVRVAGEIIVDTRGTLTLDVAPDAVFRSSGFVRVALGSALFGDPLSWGPSSSDPSWAGWANAMISGADADVGAAQARLASRVTNRDTENLDPAALARDVGALWAATALTDEARRSMLETLTRSIESTRHSGRSLSTAEVLLGLAPAYAGSYHGEEATRSLRTLLSSLRREVENHAALDTGDIVSATMAAAALALTEPTPGPRSLELMRRAARGLVRSGADFHVDGDSGDIGGRQLRSALYALASSATGDRATAFAILRTLAHGMDSLEHAGAETRAIATAVAARLTSPVSRVEGRLVRVRIDGVMHEAPLVSGVATLVSVPISAPGRHVIEFALPEGTLLVGSAEARVGRPWSAPVEIRGALSTELLGPIGARDHRAGLVLRVQNRGPRVIAHPIVSIDLPAGAELDEPSRDALRRRTAGPIQISDRTLVLSLRTLSPGATVRIPVPLRWRVGGSLRGLGIVAASGIAADAAVTIVAPRVIDIADEGRDAPGADGGS